MEEAREIGFHALQLTGGEPLLHPDVRELLRLAHGLGYKPVALFTNLTLLDDGMLDLLSDIGAQIHTSVHSLEASTHDAIPGEAGSLDRVVEGLRRVLAANLETFVGLAVMGKNTATRDETVEFLSRMGIARDHIKLDCVWPQEPGAAPFPLPDMTRRWHRLDRWDVEGESRLVAHTCWAGRTAIASNGDVFVCVGERTSLGNVASGPLRSVVETDTMRALWRITLDEVVGCQQCEFRYACFDCRAFAHLLSGDLRGRDPTCLYDVQTGRWRREEISMNSKPKRKAEFVVEEMDDDVLVANFHDSQLHILNPTAAAVWELCDGQHTAEEIADLLAEHFTLPAEEVRRDVVRILGEFQEKGLIE